MLRRCATALLLSAAIALGGAAPAHAAGGIELSHDGTTYSSGLSAPLFDDMPQLVPQQTASRTFWVRNATADDAYLTVMLDSPAWSSAQYGAALSIAASVPGRSGAPLALSSAGGCLVMLEGWVLQAGQAVAITATLALGDLDGTLGQASDASMNVGIALTEVAGLDAPVSCATPSVIVPVVPTHQGGSAGTPASASDPASDPASAPDPAATPAGPLDPLALVLANTLGSFDGSVVALSAAAVPVGAAVFFLVGLLRRRPDDETTEETP